MNIKPAHVTSGPHLDTYLLRQYDNNNQFLSPRDFWVYATPLYDYAAHNQNTSFVVDPTDWNVAQFHTIHSLLKGLPNYSVIE